MTVRRDAKKFKALAFCPDYARGSSPSAPYAVVELALARENRTFQGLPLHGARARAAQPSVGGTFTRDR